MEVALLVLIIVLVVATLAVPVRTKRRLVRRYGAADALADASVDVEQPFRLEVPASGELELMLRFTVKRYRSGGRRVSRNLAILIEARREHAAGEREVFQHRHEYLIGLSVRAASSAPTTRINTTYAITRQGSIESATAALGRIPAGGALVIEGRLTHPSTTQLESASLFVKPTTQSDR